MIIKSKHYLSPEYRKARQVTETHNRKPGDGITPEVYYRILEPLGFEVKVLPHNHDLGGHVLDVWKGRLDG